MAINPIDILLVIVILLSVLNGYRRGFVHGVLDLVGWVLSLIAGLRYSQPLAQWLGHVSMRGLRCGINRLLLC